MNKTIITTASTTEEFEDNSICSSPINSGYSTTLSNDAIIKGQIDVDTTSGDSVKYLSGHSPSVDYDQSAQELNFTQNKRRRRDRNSLHYLFREHSTVTW